MSFIKATVFVGKLDGNKTIFSSDIRPGDPYCLAFDWVANNVYVGNVLSSTIEVIRASGSTRYRSVILSNDNTALGVVTPVALAVHPLKGFVIVCLLIEIYFDLFS